MNILYITHSDPRETSFGSAQRSHFLWKALQKLGTVYTVYNVGHEIPLVRDDAARIASWRLASDNWCLRHVQAFFANVVSPMAFPFRLAGTVRRKLPWKDVKFDAVVVRYLAWADASKAWQFGPLYVDVDDLPSEAYETIHRGGHRKFTGWLWGRYVRFRERQLLKKCCGAWVANSDQVPYVERFTKCLALPNLPLPPKEGFCREGCQKLQLMTIGLMSYLPNYEGVDWFVGAVWPRVRERFPECVYAVAGGGVPECFKAKWSRIPGVKMLGFVKYVDVLYEETLAVVTPIRSGAGTCIKVGEALVRGRKVFASRFAVRGIAEADRQTCLIDVTDDAEAFAQNIIRFLSLPQAEQRARQRQIAASAARLYAPASFSAPVAALL